MSAKTQHLLIHDVDRDGWGAAALLVAQLGAGNCRLHPTVEKDGLALIDRLGPQAEHRLWLLDIPTPAKWDTPLPPAAAGMCWVDHHPAPAANEAPDGVRLFLPKTAAPTTTMHLLVVHGLVPAVHEPMAFVRSLCVPGFETAWTRIIDGLSAAWPSLPVALDELAGLLAGAPPGDAPPPGLLPLANAGLARNREVDEILDRCPVERVGSAVVVRLEDARGIPLKHFNMRARRAAGASVSLVVHDNRRIYCGRDSRGPGLDFLAHFASRGLAAKGHPYVAFVDVPKKRIEAEVEALVAALEGA